MSNIIKSSKIIEREEIIKKIEDENETEKVFIQEAREKYKNIIKNAKIKASALIEEADLKVEKQLNQSYERAKKIFEDAKIDGYQKGYDDGYKEGYENGYDKGYLEGKEVADGLINEALKIKNNYIEIKDNVYEEIEEDVINLVISIYEKIFYEKLEKDEQTIISLVLKGLDSLDVTDNIVIIVSKEDAQVVKESKNRILAEASLVEDLEIKIDNKLSKGDCIIETSKGNVDVSLKDQIEEIKHLLLNILNSE